METVWVALIGAVVAIATLLTPLLIARQSNKRLDKVAAQAAEAARLLIESDAKRTVEAAHLSKASAVLEGKVDQVHTLVNSNLTASKRAELDANILSLTLMREVIALHEAAGRAATPEALAAVDATQAKIAEQSAALDDRRLADAQVADSAQSNQVDPL